MFPLPVRERARERVLTQFRGFFVTAPLPNPLPEGEREEGLKIILQHDEEIAKQFLKRIQGDSEHPNSKNAKHGILETLKILFVFDRITTDLHVDPHRFR
jgi:hypothetical protein